MRIRSCGVRRAAATNAAALRSSSLPPPPPCSALRLRTCQCAFARSPVLLLVASRLLSFASACGAAHASAWVHMHNVRAGFEIRIQRSDTEIRTVGSEGRNVS